MAVARRVVIARLLSVGAGAVSLCAVVAPRAGGAVESSPEILREVDTPYSGDQGSEEALRDVSSAASVVSWGGAMSAPCAGAAAVVLVPELASSPSADPEAKVKRGHGAAHAGLGLRARVVILV